VSSLTCAYPGCSNKVAGLSNYCSRHQTGGGKPIERDLPEDKRRTKVLVVTPPPKGS